LSIDEKQTVSTTQKTTLHRFSVLFGIFGLLPFGAYWSLLFINELYNVTRTFNYFNSPYLGMSFVIPITAIILSICGKVKVGKFGTGIALGACGIGLNFFYCIVFAGMSRM